MINTPWAQLINRMNHLKHSVDRLEPYDLGGCSERVFLNS